MEQLATENFVFDKIRLNFSVISTSKWKISGMKIDGNTTTATTSYSYIKHGIRFFENPKKWSERRLEDLNILPQLSNKFETL